MDVNTDDLVHPPRQTRHSNPNRSYTTLAARADLRRYSFSPRTIHDCNSLDTLSRSKLIPQPPVNISCY